MGYRQQLMEMLGALNERVRSAAVTGKEKFLDFDEAYANRVGEFVYPKAERGNNGAMGAARGFGALFTGEPLRNVIPAPEVIHTIPPKLGAKIGGEAFRYAIPAGNIAARYVLPAMGVTAAGKGLYDLTQMFSPYEKDEEEAQIII